MCERKASSDLMSVMVDIMRVVALEREVEYVEVKRKESYEETLPMSDCTAHKEFWGKKLSCHKGYSQEMLRNCRISDSYFCWKRSKVQCTDDARFQTAENRCYSLRRYSVVVSKLHSHSNVPFSNVPPTSNALSTGRQFLDT